MQIKIVAVGRVRDRNLSAKTEDFIKRISHYASRLEIVEIADSNVLDEGQKILKHFKDQKCNFALGEEGKEYSSREFAQLLQKCDGRALFAIGGPDGLSDSVKESAQQILSLSRMTFTHEMARFLLAEQIYRAFSIINNTKYHRD